MKILKIKPESIEMGEFAEKVRAHFGTKYTVTNNKHEITIAKTKAIGCKVVLTKKRVMINGTFPTLSRLIIAMIIFVFGGIVIPMGIYMIAFKDKFKMMEIEVEAFMRNEYPDRLL